MAADIGILGLSRNVQWRRRRKTTDRGRSSERGKVVEEKQKTLTSSAVVCCQIAKKLELETSRVRKRRGR